MPQYNDVTTVTDPPGTGRRSMYAAVALFLVAILLGLALAIAGAITLIVVPILALGAAALPLLIFGGGQLLRVGIDSLEVALRKDLNHNGYIGPAPYTPPVKDRQNYLPIYSGTGWKEIGPAGAREDGEYYTIPDLARMIELLPVHGPSFHKYERTVLPSGREISDYDNDFIPFVRMLEQADILYNRKPGHEGDLRTRDVAKIKAKMLPPS